MLHLSALTTSCLLRVVAVSVDLEQWVRIYTVTSVAARDQESPLPNLNPEVLLLFLSPEQSALVFVQEACMSVLAWCNTACMGRRALND